MAIALALAAAASWGLADFLAGLASRRAAVPVVLLLVEGGGLLVIGVYAAASGEAFFSQARDVWLAIAGGASGVLALGCFYRALAIGTMSVVAPISASGVVLPVVVGVATGNALSAIVVVGFVAVIAGVVLVSREEHADAAAAAVSRQSVLLALGAALGFGAYFALIDVPSDASVTWTLVCSRAAATVLVAAGLPLLRPPRPPRRLGVAVFAVGSIDLLATVFIGLANTRGELSVVSVISGMYPVMTVLLAAAVLRERVRVPQLAGIVLALGGVALVAAG